MSSSETIEVNYAAFFIGAVGLVVCFAGLVLMAVFGRFGLGFPFVGMGFTVFLTTAMASAKTTGGFYGN